MRNRSQDKVEWAEKYYDSPEINNVVGSNVLKSQMGSGWWIRELKDHSEVDFRECGDNRYGGSIVRPIKPR